MKNFSKILSALLATVLLFSVVVTFSACKKGNTEGTQNTGSVSTEASGLSSLEVKDLGGFTLVMLWPEMHTDGHYIHNELTGSDTAGDVIDQAVATRNLIVETTYNVKITSETQFVSTVPKTVRNEAEAGESSYHAIASTIKFMTPIAQEGLLTDFKTLDYYSESQEWWNHDLMKDFAIANARYFASGDIIYSDDFYPYCTYVNTTVSQDIYGIDEDYYQLVKNKQWTLEKFHELAKLAVNPEADGDPDTWSEEDMNGAVVNENFARAAFYSAGKGMLSFDKAGYPVWNMTVDYTQPILEKIIGIIHKDSACFNTGVFDDHAGTELSLFTDNKTLFLVEELIISERITKSEKSANFQILPYPLYDENSDYICVLNDAAVIGIPVMVNNANDISLILSAMSRESINTLTPAFFETVLTYRYMQDPGSVETLEIILSSTVAPDVATVQDWGGFMTKFKELAFSNSTAFSSYYSGNIGKAMGKLEEYNLILDRYYENN